MAARRSKLVKLLALPLLLALLTVTLPARADRPNAYGDNPTSYGETLVYDNATGNPAPGDAFNGGYNGYPAPNGITLSPGMYKVHITFQGSNISARIYKKSGTGPCSETFNGIYLDGQPDDTGFFAVMPVEGQSSPVTTVCAAVYINWQTGISVRVQIWRVFPGPQTMNGTNYFAGQFAVDGLSGQLGTYSSFYYDQSFDVPTTPFTVTLDVQWQYHTATTASIAAIDPFAVHNDEVNPSNCIYIVPPSGSGPPGPDRVCAGGTAVLTRVGTYHIHVTGYEATYAYIYNVKAFIGSDLPTATPTTSPTPVGTATPPVTCLGLTSFAVSSQSDGGTDNFIYATDSIYADNGTVVIVINGSPTELPAYSSFPAPGFTLSPPSTSGIYHFYSTATTYPGDPALVRICPPAPTPTTTATATRTPCGPGEGVGVEAFSTPTPTQGLQPTPTPDCVTPTPASPTPTHAATATHTATPTATATGTATTTASATSSPTPLPPTATATTSATPTNAPTATATEHPQPTGISIDLTAVCLVPTSPTYPDERGPVPDLGFVVATWAPLPTAVTATLVLSASSLISSTQRFATAIAQPVSQISQWSQAQFGPDGWQRGMTDAAPLALAIAGVFGWLALFGMLGQLNWLLPPMLISLAVQIAKALLSIAKYIKQILPFQ